MKPFHTIAIPHQSILQEQLTMDVFTPDLWKVFKERGSEDYIDPDRFFQSTYQTDSLKRIVSSVEKRMCGQGGDPIIHIQAPSGNGKTHALLHLYHRAASWKATPIVIAGNALSSSDTLWQTVAEQILVAHASTSDLPDEFTEYMPPGREALHLLLEQAQPLIILIDEVLDYFVKAAAFPVGESTLAAQSLAFLKELTGVCSTLQRVTFVMTLPGMSPDAFDSETASFLKKLRKMGGHAEKVYVTVQEHEAPHIVRQRMFAALKPGLLAHFLDQYMRYATREFLLPAGIEVPAYRNRFEASYPFLPEMLDTLYQRWGSFADFQGIRGLLRVIALIVNAHKTSSHPYLSLADIDLSNQEIRQELLEYAGSEFEEIITTDITGEHAGVRTLDAQLTGKAEDTALGTRIATTIFLHSFAHHLEQNATSGVIKRHAVTFGLPSRLVSELLDPLLTTLFYLKHEYGCYYFDRQPNLNKLLLAKRENIAEPALDELERSLLKKKLGQGWLKVFLWEQEGKPPSIPDDGALKLVILKAHDVDVMTRLLRFNGESPRVHQNTLFFLAPSEEERLWFSELLKQSLACGMVMADMTLNLSKDQWNDIKTRWRQTERDLSTALRRYYRLLCIPDKDGMTCQEMHVPTYAEWKKIDETVYDFLASAGEIREYLAPQFIHDHYLAEHGQVFTKHLLTVGTTTPGHVRVLSPAIWERGIREGVQQGLFGLGFMDKDKPFCCFFKHGRFTVDFSDDEVLIREDLCSCPRQSPAAASNQDDTAASSGRQLPASALHRLSRIKTRKQVRLRFTLTRQKVTGFIRILNQLKRQFNRITIDIDAQEGEISEVAYKIHIENMLEQLEIEWEEE